MRTTIVGYLMIAVAVINFVVDVLDGGGIDFTKHFDSISVALAGAGFIFARKAIGKLENK